MESNSSYSLQHSFYSQPFFKHHMIEKVPDCLESDYSINREVSFSTSPTVPYTRIVKRIWHYGVSIFLVFFVTLAVYPAVTVLVESEYKGKGYAWNGNLKSLYIPQYFFYRFCSLNSWI